jgi:hypothetical protein
MTMRAISLWQPWASLLAHGQKRVETRHWPIKSPGPLVVHAAQKWSRELAAQTIKPPFSLALRAAGYRLPGDRNARMFRRPVAETDGTRNGPLPLGCLLGVVELVACVPTERIRFVPGWTFASVHNRTAEDAPELWVGENEQAFGDYAPGRFGWLCAAFHPFPTPIVYAGGRRIFQVPDVIIPKEFRGANPTCPA